MNIDKIDIIPIAIGCVLIIGLAVLVGCFNIKGAITDMNDDTNDSYISDDVMEQLEAGGGRIYLNTGSAANYIQVYSDHKVEQKGGTLIVTTGSTIYHIQISQILYITT